MLKIKNRCISESGRLISNVVEMCDTLDIPGYLVTLDIEKIIRSCFFIKCFKKRGFGENFIHWITIMRYKWKFYNSIF